MALASDQAQTITGPTAFDLGGCPPTAANIVACKLPTRPKVLNRHIAAKCSRVSSPLLTRGAKMIGLDQIGYRGDHLA